MICHPRTLSKPTPSEEEYLKALYLLEEVGKKVRVKDLANYLQIKASSIVEMLERLAKQKFVKYDRLGMKLTPKGQNQAIGVIRRHQLAERLLSDVLHYRLSKVHDIAGELEHVFNNELAEKIDQVLGKPKTCPHGELIPGHGKTLKSGGKPLTELKKNEEGLVIRIPEERGLVERLLSLNILPGTKLKLVEKLPWGTIIVKCGKTQIVLGKSITSQILVQSSS